MYESPEIRIIPFAAESLVCQSPGTDTGAVTIDGYTEEEFEW